MISSIPNYVQIICIWKEYLISYYSVQKNF